MAKLPIDLTGKGGLAPGFAGDLNDTVAVPSIRYLGGEDQMASGIYDPSRLVGYMAPANNTYLSITGTLSNEIVCRTYSATSDLVYLGQNGTVLSTVSTLAGTTSSTLLTLDGQSAFKDVEMYEINGEPAVLYAYSYADTSTSNITKAALGFYSTDQNKGMFQLSAKVYEAGVSTSVMSIGNGGYYQGAPSDNRALLAQRFRSLDMATSTLNIATTSASGLDQAPGLLKVSGLRLRLRTVAGVTQTWTLKVGIQTDTSGAPSGSYITNGSTTVAASTLPTGDFDYVYFAFPATINLTYSTVYHIVIEPTIIASTLGAGQGVSWYMSDTSSSVYSNGVAEYGSVTANLLVVGGGGAGARSNGVGFPGGGGGAGQYQPRPTQIVSGMAYTITVGAGGTTAAAGAIGGSGADSVFDAANVLLEVRAKGGAGGAPFGVPAVSGGSGGGGSGGSNNSTALDPLYGHDGAPGNGSGNGSGGGGGGATAAGTNGAPGVGGTGGAGTANSISGASVTYAGGGGGGVNGGLNTQGAGGAGGGGAGGVGAGTGTNGTANTGGGGGGTWSATAGAGGSGVVIISLPTGVISSATGGTFTQSGGNDIWTFTTSGTWTPTFSTNGTVVWSNQTSSFDFALILNQFQHLIGPDAQDSVVYTLQELNYSQMFLQKADNGYLYIFAGPNVHKFAGGFLDGDAGSFTPSVLAFPKYLNCVDAFDTSSLMYIGVQSSLTTVPDSKTYAADTMGIYVWDRQSTSANMQNFIPIYGAKAIKKVYVNADGDIRVITIGGDRFTEVRGLVNGRMVVLQRLGLFSYPVYRDSFDVLNGMATWLGADGITYSMGRIPHATSAVERVYKIGDITANGSGTLSPGVLFAGHTESTQSRQGVFISMSDTVAGKKLLKWYPHGVGTISSVAQLGHVGQPYTLQKQLPYLSTVERIKITCVPYGSAGDSTTVATIKFYKNMSSTPFMSKTVTRNDIVKGFLAYEINTSYINTFGISIDWSTSQTLGTNDFCPSTAVLDITPTQTLK